jgi:4-carboxymuconolactone decarboxylase
MPTFVRVTRFSYGGPTIRKQRASPKAIETHVWGAFNAGASEADVVETVMTLIPYVGFPKALNAMAIVKRVVERRRAGEEGSS